MSCGSAEEISIPENRKRAILRRQEAEAALRVEAEKLAEEKARARADKNQGYSSPDWNDIPEKRKEAIRRKKAQDELSKDGKNQGYSSTDFDESDEPHRKQSKKNGLQAKRARVARLLVEKNNSATPEEIVAAVEGHLSERETQVRTRRRHDRHKRVLHGSGTSEGENVDAIGKVMEEKIVLKGKIDELVMRNNELAESNKDLKDFVDQVTALVGMMRIQSPSTREDNIPEVRRGGLLMRNTEEEMLGARSTLDGRKKARWRKAEEAVLAAEAEMLAEARMLAEEKARAEPDKSQATMLR